MQPMGNNHRKKKEIQIVLLKLNFRMYLCDNELLYLFLIWRPIYRQPVYVGIYLPLAPAHSNYRLETKKHNLKSFCNE
jgi:hypothetical protein